MVWGSVSAFSQWDPAQGQWGKEDPTDVRIMTYNVEDNICSTQPKVEGYNAWHALTRVVAAMRPDILLLQEAGDNEGNATGQNVDTVADLETTIGLFLYGGADPFLGGTVEAYVQKYAPGYDLPYVYVNTATDTYNRNVILSKFPFADLNGDGVSQRYDIHVVLPDQYAPGGTGGIRGFMFAELDLPNGTYAGDLVVGNAHLKASNDPDSKARRLKAAKNVAYYIDYLLNGGGTGVPDPHDKIGDLPPVTQILDPNTPVVIGGDWNEDEQYNGRRGPADWLTQAEFFAGGDGTDRDRSDALYDMALEPRLGSRSTYGDWGSKLDYVGWQDSIATLRRSFVFISGALNGAPSWFPPEIVGFPFPGQSQPQNISAWASDHRPVIVDLILPQPQQVWCLGDANCSGGPPDFTDIEFFVAALAGPATWNAYYEATHGGQSPPCDYLINDMNGGGVEFTDIQAFVQGLGQPCLPF
jgi:endonuclease/exonuclease/phosphatase family metal-dependent hydrolase